MGVEDHLGPRVRTFFPTEEWLFWQSTEGKTSHCGSLSIICRIVGELRRATTAVGERQASFSIIIRQNSDELCITTCSACTVPTVFLKKVSFSLRLFGSVQHCAVCVQLLWHVASLSVTARVLLTKACWEPYKLSSIYPLPYHASRTIPSL